ncbi:hypothetical protein CVT25_004137 [Psilocybe cyanescens]|uniref:Uncharacterized protein n=1 Tax=Psilocybe cyanescens TaxID=93625 RepID=A0A409XKW0_PSICY|nr:hypothetical protein CVT25_004137 [Psilocybe cyanescens]
MSENNAVARGGNGNPRVEVEALLALVRNQFPTLATGAAITTEIVNQVTESIRRNIGLLGSGLTATSLAVLLPSLAIAIVNAIGCTAGGIAAGSMAAAIQSAFYGAYTTGLISTLQAFGATAVIAFPAALILGSISLATGVGFLGHWLYKRHRASLSGVLPGQDSDDLNDNLPPVHPSENKAVAVPI